MIDTVKKIQGGIDVIDCVSGAPILKFQDTAKLCSIATLKFEEDIQSGSDVEYIFCGSSKSLSS